ERVQIGVNGDAEPLVVLSLPTSLREGEPIEAEVHLMHPVLAPHAERLRDRWMPVATKMGVSLVNVGGRSGQRTIELDNEYQLSFAIAPRRRSALPPLSEPLRVIADDVLGQGDESPGATAIAEVRNFLEMVVLGTSAQLAATLRDALYIGPL